jgi:predicted permease
MGGEHGGPPVKPAVFKAWKDSGVFSAVESATARSSLVSSDAGDVQRGVARVTPGIFDLLGGVRPVRGRLFDASEGKPGANDRVLVSEDVWRELYRSDPGLVGRTIRIDGEPVVVIGILPSELRFPNWDTVIWRADNFDSAAVVVTDVRFKKNVPQSDALRLASEIAKQADPTTAKLSAQARPLASFELDPYYQRAVPLLAGGVVLLFLVLCANVSSLLLAGFAARGREIGTRVALGASRGQLIRQALLENMTMGLTGALVGAALGWALVSIARAVLPQAALVRSLNPLDIDWRALGATSAAGLMATLIAGTLPAWIGTRIDSARLLQLAGPTSSETLQSRFFRRALLVGQIALSCALVFAATLLVHSFANLVWEDRGIDTKNTFIVRPSFGPSISTQPARVNAEHLVKEQALAIPGVIAASWSYGTPPAGGINPTENFTSDIAGAPAINMKVNLSLIDADFFKLYGVPILRGRGFQSTDGTGVAIVSESFARTLWGESDPIGRSFVSEKAFASGLQIIGLVKEVHYPSLNRSLESPQVYVPYAGGAFGSQSMTLKCDARCPNVMRMRTLLADKVPGTRIDSVTPLENAYFRELAKPRAAASLAAIFAVTALVAASAGLFSLLSHSYLRRRREFGIRSALGAAPADVRFLVWWEGLCLAGLGIGIGAFFAGMLARPLDSLLFKVAVTDPLTILAVVTILALTIVAASWYPARAAGRTSPVELLRE